MSGKADRLKGWVTSEGRTDRRVGSVKQMLDHAMDKVEEMINRATDKSEEAVDKIKGARRSK